MSNKELEKRHSDFTPEELESLQDWKDNGRPGLTKINIDDTVQWFDLYMSGKSYSEIASICKVKRDIVLHASERANWVERKEEYYADISQNIIKKYKQAKMENINTMTTMISAMNKYFAKKFDKYLSTNDDSIIEKIDSKMLIQYQKISESMTSLINEASGKKDESKAPTININMGDKSKIKQNDDNTVEIEANNEEEEVKDILDKLAKVKKLRTDS